MDHLIIKPIPVPRTGFVKQLKLNVAPGQADVYVEQTRWPRQKQNPNWRIEVTGIDGRHDVATQQQIRDACEAVARLYLARWLAKVAPLLTLETVSWPELVRFATERPRRVPSPYQQRRRRNKHARREPLDTQIDLPLTTKTRRAGSDEAEEE